MAMHATQGDLSRGDEELLKYLRLPCGGLLQTGLNLGNAIRSWLPIAARLRPGSEL